MAIVYAKEKETLAEAMATHGRAWDFRGGGITFNECSATYQYPSGGLQYHLRYILLHEATHLFQACLAPNLRSMPSWYTEGVADLLSHHVKIRGGTENPQCSNRSSGRKIHTTCSGMSRSFLYAPAGLDYD